LRANGYSYLQSRKKGLLKKNDCQIRLKFARRNLLEQSADFWTKNIGMFLDGTSFVYKSNPHDQARAPILVQCYVNSTTVELMVKSLRRLLQNIFQLYFPGVKTNQHVYYKMDVRYRTPLRQGVLSKNLAQRFTKSLQEVLT